MLKEEEGINLGSEQQNYRQEARDCVRRNNNIMLNTKQIQTILEFLKRTPLRGDETPAFNEVVFLLNEELKKQVEPAEKPAEDKPKK